MDVITNIKKYIRSFNILSKNSENMFSDYLKKNKLTEIEFLYQIGLNKNLINEHNFEEIQKIISLNLSKEKFPLMSFPIDGESLERDNLSIYNPENKCDIVIGENFIRFDNNQDESSNKQINHISYILENDVIKKVTIEISYSVIENSNMMDYFNIKAEQIEYTINGEVKSNNNYTINSKVPLYQSTFKTIYRSLLHGSIVPGIAKTLELIKTGKINKSDLEIDLNMADLLKK